MCIRDSNKPSAETAPAQKSASVRDLERRLSIALGTKCEVRDLGGKGEIAVHYASLDALDEILNKIMK